MTDTQIIDWMEAQAKKSPSGISFDYVRKCDEDPSGFRFMRRFFISEPCKSIREVVQLAATLQGQWE